MFDLVKSSTPTSSTYSLYFKRGYAHFTLVPTLGIVHAQTDWGDYCYRWSNIGNETLEEFLLDLDAYYIGTKFCGRPKYINENATRTAILRDLLVARKSNHLTKDEAKQLYDDIQILDCDSIHSQDFYDSFGPIVEKLYDGDYSSLPICMCYSSWQTTFIDDIFPAFQKHLRSIIKG